MLERTDTESLADLRAEIDRLDQRLHAVLMERSEIIDRLIAVKAGAGGSAFRPDREAEMMRRLVSRHRGILPLDTVESIWRVIISTFTYVQASYSVHCDVSGGDAAMRDGCRFHFGFTVPFVSHQGSGQVIDAVAASSGDLGLVAVEAPRVRRRLVEATGLGLGAEDHRAPSFVERPNHPAGLPLFVIAKPLTEAAARDVVLYDVVIERWPDVLENTLTARDAEILASAQDGKTTSLLIAAPGQLSHAAFDKAFAEAGTDVLNRCEIGSHAARFDLAKVQPGAVPPGEFNA